MGNPMNFLTAFAGLFKANQEIDDHARRVVERIRKIRDSRFEKVPADMGSIPDDDMRFFDGVSREASMLADVVGSVKRGDIDAAMRAGEVANVRFPGGGTVFLLCKP